MGETRSVEFERSLSTKFVFRLIAAACLALAAKSYVLKEVLLAVGWGLAAFFWHINSRVRYQTPYVRVTPDEIIIFSSPVLKPSRFKLRDIINIDGVGLWKLKLTVRTEKNVVLSLVELAKDDREKLVKSIREKIRDIEAAQ